MTTGHADIAQHGTVKGNCRFCPPQCKFCAEVQILEPVAPSNFATLLFFTFVTEACITYVTKTLINAGEGSAGIGLSATDLEMIISCILVNIHVTICVVLCYSQHGHKGNYESIRVCVGIIEYTSFNLNSPKPLIKDGVALPRHIDVHHCLTG